MALALKYRLLCGSLVLTSPLIYHEWYYSQLQARSSLDSIALKDGVHYVALDMTWSQAEQMLHELRASEQAQELISGDF